MKLRYAMTCAGIFKRLGWATCDHFGFGQPGRLFTCQPNLVCGDVVVSACGLQALED